MNKKKKIKKLIEKVKCLDMRILILENSTRERIRNICPHDNKKIVFIKNRSPSCSSYVYDRYEKICKNCGIILDTIRIYDNDDYYCEIDPNTYSDKLNEWIVKYGPLEFKCEK